MTTTVNGVSSDSVRVLTFTDSTNRVSVLGGFIETPHIDPVTNQVVVRFIGPDGDIMRKVMSPNQVKMEQFGVRVKPKTDADIISGILADQAHLTSIYMDVLNGKSRLAIISGPPGLGKTYTIDKLRAKYGAGAGTIGGKLGATFHNIIDKSGSAISYVGLYVELQNNRSTRDVLVLDDADGIWFDNTVMGLMKAAYDTRPVRNLSYMKSAKSAEQHGVYDTDFVYNGRGVIITNYNLDGKHNDPAVGPILSRARKLVMNGWTMRERVLHLTLLIKEGVCGSEVIVTPEDTITTTDEHGNELQIHVPATVLPALDDKMGDAIRDWLLDNQRILTTLTLRDLQTMRVMIDSNPDNWQKVAMREIAHINI